MKRPNILWICTDRQRHDTLGAYGNEFVRTPNLDRLARGGAIFQQAWSQSPVCSPSRASFLTGRYPRTTGLNRNGQMLPAHEKIVPRYLADAGYVCGHAGKLHLAPGSPRVAHWCERRRDDGYSVFDWSLHPPTLPCPYTAWLHENGIEFKRTAVGGSKYVQFGMPPESSNTGWLAQRAINFIHGSAKMEWPWFFTCNIEDPHSPFDPPRTYLEPHLARLRDIPLPRYTSGELDRKPQFQRTDREGAWGGGRAPNAEYAAENMTDDDHRLIRAAYWAMIDHIDFQVGRMMNALRETGQLDNTLMLFMSDHGEMLGDHGMYCQGPYFYDEMVRVPLIMNWPAQIKSGVCSSAFVELVDLAPTLLEAAGLQPDPGMQGRSLLPLLTGKVPPDQHRDDVYCEYYQAIPGRHQPTAGAYVTGLRTASFALTVAHGRDEGELYDLKRDPHQMNNLWRSAEHAPAKMEMLKRLCDRMAATIDPLPLIEEGVAW
jgi:arylsulfatase